MARTRGWNRVELGEFAAGDELDVEFSFDCWLTPQEYTLTVATQNADGSSHDWVDDAIAFEVVDAKSAAGVANLRAEVTVDKAKPRARFTVKVQPRAKETALAEKLGDAYKLRLAAPPVDGKANEACIRFFADAFRRRAVGGAHRAGIVEPDEGGGNRRSRSGAGGAYTWP